MMKRNKKQNPDNSIESLSGKEIYKYFGETEEEIILQMKKRKEENEALKKLIENLNSTISGTKSKKNV